MIVATKTQSHELKENRTAGLSSAVVLNSLKRHFLKSTYSLDGQDISDDDLSALLVHFGLSSLKQNGSIKTGTSEIKGNDLLSLSNYLFDSLKNFLPEKIAAAMPPSSMASLDKAKLFYDSNIFKNEHKEYLFQDIANIGFAYQIFSLGIRNKEALAAVQSANKQISRKQLISFTQLYTPGWVVDFILANTVLPFFWQWKEKFPARYATWIAAEPLATKKEFDLSTFNILDPACGAGQFLFSAFDLLSSLLELAGYRKDESTSLALENIYGADIDEKALWVAGLGLLCKSLLATGNVPAKLSNLIWSEKEGDTGFLGSIDRNWSKKHVLNQSYNAVVINPPYLGRKCLSRELKTTLLEQYPDSSTDLCAAFLKRGGEMLKPNGRLGIITQSSVLSIPSYRPLRTYLFNNYIFETIVRCGPGVFPLANGEKIDSVLLIAEKPGINRSSIAGANTRLVDLHSEKDKPNKLQEILSTVLDNKDDGYQTLFPAADNKITKLADGLTFGLPYQLVDKFASFPKLGDIADIRQGLATTDNGRFVRYNFDVDPNSIGSLWIPYIKGAGAEQFACENPFVVKWGNKGEEIKKAVAEAYPYLKGKTAWVVKNEEFYFRPGLCFSFINKSGLAVRRLPAGAIFDVGSSAIFAKLEEEDFLLAYLNSSLLGLLAKTINQTINVQVGDLKKLPIFPFSTNTKGQLAALGQNCFLAKQKLLQLQQIDLKTLGKTSQSLISAGQLESSFTEYETEYKKLSEQLKTLQIEIDCLVLKGLKELGILTVEEEDYLHNILSSRRADIKDSRFDPTLFTAKIFIGLVSSLICDDQHIEHIRLIPKTDSRSLAQSFGLSDDGKDWLEQKLGSPLDKLFCRSKVMDINKLARDPSRYFGLFVEKSNSYMFFSARAVRQLFNSPTIDHPTNWFWQYAFKQLNNSQDWTSKGLLKVVIDALRTASEQVS